MATKRRARRYTETADYLSACRRMIRGAGRRVGGCDPEQLAELVGLADDLAAAVAVAVAGQKAAGITWQSIGEATGTTREAAFQKWAKAARAVDGKKPLQP